MISQADGARIMAAAAKWVKASRGSALSAMSKKCGGGEYVAILEIEDAAERAFAELVSALTEPE